ncbi:uncharacterized protein LOC127873620 isoform X3 [Dreissena polymorpha]|uniref:uncharacterized protein LOC127873620 isoform X3 n=1 Tax=Dreissena polymorpha TaxID=45954 RepID=UPI002264BDA2|nr:uncharacterized protein LOC127873620 isoform X3 [Dreissena polymorpha]
MSDRMNGYGSDRERRPPSEQMADLHVYLVPPDIWRDKFNNALNQYINDTISIGFIRVHPEMKVYALRDEIDQQLGTELVPREYVFLKSVGRSLTRLKSKQEATLKVKHFLPPQAYAPELYLLEATPEVRQAIAASSEGSTRPQTRTSYEYEFQPTGNSKSEDVVANAKHSHLPNGAGLHSYYPTLPQISHTPYPQQAPTPLLTKTSPTPRIEDYHTEDYHNHRQDGSYHHDDEADMPEMRSPMKQNVFKTTNQPANVPGPQNSPQQHIYKAYQTKPPIENIQTDLDQPHSQFYPDPHEINDAYQNNPATTHNHNPRVSQTSYQNNPGKTSYQNHTEKPSYHDPQERPKQYPEEPTNSSNTNASTNTGTININRPPRDLRVSHPPPVNSDPHLDPSLHHMASSPRRQQGSGPDRGQDEYLPPLSATPPHGDSDKARGGKPGRSDNHGNHHKNEEDSGIAGFSPETYRENEPLDRRKDERNGNERLAAPSGNQEDDEEVLNRSPENENGTDWDRQRCEEEERRRREEEERRRREEEERRRRENEQARIEKEADQMKTNDDEEMARFPSPPPMRLSSPERDTASAKARRKKQKDELLKELEEAREARRTAERQREELVRQARQMQAKTQNRRSHARDLWKKRYFDEKKKTLPLEEQSNRLRHELDIIHKRLLATLEGPKEKATKLNDLKSPGKVGSPGRPLSFYDRQLQAYRKMNNFKVQATRLQHEIEDVRRRVDHAKMKLTSEMKLRNQAETELRALRAELMQKKINLTLSRNSHLTTYAPPAADVNFMTARSTAITPRS